MQETPQEYRQRSWHYFVEYFNDRSNSISNEGSYNND
jgi:hypothetical protein